MSIEKQQLDANCNDCKFMVRNMERFKQSLEFHKDLQLKDFEREKKRLLDLARYHHREKGDLEVFQMLSTQADKMKFQFNKDVVKINYGSCDKLNKPVSFIPGHIQLETQQCFEHRKS
jgi:hypothetical protein